MRIFIKLFNFTSYHIVKKYLGQQYYYKKIKKILKIYCKIWNLKTETNYRHVNGYE